MVFLFKKDKADEKESPERSGDWYADPYGDGARRWFDETRGWTDRVEGAGQEPDKTGLARMDEAADSSEDSPDHLDADGKPAPLSRPVDAQYMADARPVL
jgi:hypothetical protein